MSIDGGDQRVAWIDHAKGICIAAVVGMYATLYVQGLVGADGWMQHWADFAKPFRMPDFFLLSGLFLARTLDRPWRDYLDTKVVHFIYFFALWTTIYFVATVLDGNFQAGENLWLTYFWWYVEPFHMLWFIEMLPIYFVVTRATRKVPWIMMLGLAAALQIWAPDTGVRQLDRFGERYVYFYAGYIFAPMFFALADWTRSCPRRALALLAVWAFANEALVLAGIADWRVVSLILGIAGASAVIMVASLFSTVRKMDWLRYMGEHSIMVFLAFFAVMVASARVLSRAGIAWDVGTLTLLVTILASAGPIVLFWASQRTPLRFLFMRPAWATIKRRIPMPTPKVPPGSIPVP